MVPHGARTVEAGGSVLGGRGPGRVEDTGREATGAVSDLEVTISDTYTLRTT